MPIGVVNANQVESNKWVVDVFKSSVAHVLFVFSIESSLKPFFLVCNFDKDYIHESISVETGSHSRSFNSGMTSRITYNDPKMT